MGTELLSFSAAAAASGAAAFRFLRAPFLSDFVPLEDDEEGFVFFPVTVEPEDFAVADTIRDEEAPEEEEGLDAPVFKFVSTPSPSPLEE